MSDQSSPKPPYANGRRNRARMERGAIVGDRINELYLNSVAGVPRIRQTLKIIQEEVEEFGVTTLQRLDHEIQVATMLVTETLYALSNLPDDVPTETRERRAKALRYEIDTHLETLRKLKETNHNMHYGPKFGVRIDEVENLMKFVMQVIMSRVRDADTLKKIARDFEEIGSANFKTDVMRGVREIEVRKHDEGSEVDMGQNTEAIVADDSGSSSDSGAGSDAGV